MKLAKAITDILESRDINIISTEPSDNGKAYTELEFYSNAGEDFIISLWHERNKRGFIDAFIQYAIEFDPDEHAEQWIEGRGTNGIPGSIRELINDADWINEFLDETAVALRTAY